MTAGTTLLIDSREPREHPWAPFAPPEWRIERATLETGDLALAANPSIVVERKAPEDLIGCLAQSRERFEAELRRSRNSCDSFVVVVEGSMADLHRLRRGLHWSAVVGTIAAWTRRYAPIILAGDVEQAAHFAFRYLAQPIAEARRLVAAADKVREA
ncbi:MAG: ERCC4 domain-containing protein [Verrucomicrobiales bacterium]